MCGISGILITDLVTTSGNIEILSTVNVMTDALMHRGPDSRGVWVNEDRSVGLGHRRLAIRDLSPNGHQPMESSCGRYMLVYNGEVYSHLELVAELERHNRIPKGTSDTEVIIESCAQWGVEYTAKRLIGMFAFALYDRKTRDLYLVRDRLGIKPIYWGNLDGIFLFGSELKALTAAKFWHKKINRQAVASFLRHNYIPAPLSIYENVYKLEPGTILQIKSDGTVRSDKFWDLQEIAIKNIANPIQGTETEIINSLDSLLQDAVKRRLVADVPIGSLLSGGVDSSIVTALMAEQSEQKINTFSIGFQEKEYNEAPYAREIAKHLGTQHTELYVDPNRALEIVKKLPYWYDEPFSDSSQIPTIAVCELTKQHVTVVLSGDGGDELFAGYNRYIHGLEMWQKSQIAPLAIRKPLSKLLLSQPQDRLEKLGFLVPKKYKVAQLGNKLHKFANAILLDDPDAMYRGMLSHWTEPENLVLGASEYKGILWDSQLIHKIPDFLDRMQFLDMQTYLPDDILTKVDRASMSVALEARVPLLDHRIVEMAWGLPQNMKLRNGVGKWALREVLYKRVPRQLIERPKMGFGIPIDQWLRGPLKSWVGALLDEGRLRKQGLLNADMVHERWNKHLQGENWGYPLWDVIMLQAWLEANPDIEI